VPVIPDPIRARPRTTWPPPRSRASPVRDGPPGRRRRASAYRPPPRSPWRRGRRARSPLELGCGKCRPRIFPSILCQRARSHVRVIRAAAPFRYDPIDILLRILDVASLAVNAILRVDLQIWVSCFNWAHDFIDARGTITLFRRIVEPIVDRDRLRRVAQAEMGGLVLFMVGVRDEHR